MRQSLKGQKFGTQGQKVHLGGGGEKFIYRSILKTGWVIKGCSVPQWVKCLVRGDKQTIFDHIHSVALTCLSPGE